MPFLEDIKNKVDRYLDDQYIERLRGNVEQVFKQMQELKGWTTKELQLATVAFKQDLASGKTLDDIMVPAFAVAAESARRIVGQTPYDVQVLSGIIIHRGKVAEMKAGEGKTLTETMPVYLNALAGRGVHVVTTNDYLAERDAKAMGKLYGFLGLSVGYVGSDMKNDERRKGYASDITYVANQEIGFDYLRDNLVFARADRVLRKDHPLNYGIVDEIDSILIDESRTPLIIANAGGETREDYGVWNERVNKLVEDEDFTVDYQHKNAQLTTAGYDRIEKMTGHKLYSAENPADVFYLDVCLKARLLFEKDRDYIVTKDGIEIVDEFTGRVLPGRRFTDGVHQAIEAKEKSKVKGGDKTSAAITFQNFFPTYEKLSGMSGTVMRARGEFKQVYKLDVVQIPTHRPMQRVDHHDLFFKTKRGKYQYMLKKIAQLKGAARPVLIGTRNVETAHDIAAMLEENDFSFQMLTAADNRAEADKIGKAGQQGMVTLATNMAGRGTDILLGPGVREVGGLFVIGTERHESRRIDDQLVGRSGRQGDVGETQFLISMEDEIMQLFGSESVIDVMEDIDIPEDEGIGGVSLDRAFAHAQDLVESKNYDGRLYLYKYDRVTNFQREEVYRMRDSLLENEEGFKKFYGQSVGDVLSACVAAGSPDEVAAELRVCFSVDVPLSQLSELAEGSKVSPAAARKTVYGRLYDTLLGAAGRIDELPDVYQAAQSLVLKAIDESWSDHIEAMDVLKEEASLFSYASADPLLDYIKDGRALFSDMGVRIQKRFISKVFEALKKSGKLE